MVFQYTKIYHWATRGRFFTNHPFFSIIAIFHDQKNLTPILKQSAPELLQAIEEYELATNLDKKTTSTPKKSRTFENKKSLLSK